MQDKDMLRGLDQWEDPDPPKPVEVTDAGAPLLCAKAADTKSVTARTATVAAFSRFTKKSYSRFKPMARSLSIRSLLIRTRWKARSCGIFGRIREDRKVVSFHQAGKHNASLSAAHVRQFRQIPECIGDQQSPNAGLDQCPPSRFQQVRRHSGNEHKQKRHGQ